MDFKLYAKFKNGEISELNNISDEKYFADGIEVTFREKKSGNVTAYYVSAKSDKPFDCDCAISVVIKEIEGMKSYMSGSSTYTDYNCWYAPVFGSDLKKVAPITQSFMWEDGTKFGAILCACDECFKSAIRLLSLPKITDYMNFRQVTKK